MVRLEFSTELAYDVFSPGCDFIFNVEAAHTRRQTVISESLDLSQDVPARAYTDPATHSRFLLLRANAGPFTLRYRAVVELDHDEAAPETLAEASPHELPGEVLPYLYPSRYCPSDRLLTAASQSFGGLPRGYSRAQAICEWVGEHVSFQSNTSNSNTSAVDTLVDRVGVCRDFAHLMIALCRASNLPARMASGMDYGADVALGPQDFHAYVEVFVGGRWCIFDPSGTAIPMGFARFGTGRDAADIAFATIFGAVSAAQPVIRVEAVPHGDGKLVVPQRVAHALSTDSP
ncbi:MAG: transglutaminase family protein [Polaromonas sp.]|nr:transglutaminase family protein [Polaromonas sp.]